MNSGKADKPRNDSDFGHEIQVHSIQHSLTTNNNDQKNVINCGFTSKIEDVMQMSDRKTYLNTPKQARAYRNERRELLNSK